MRRGGPRDVSLLLSPLDSIVVLYVVCGGVKLANVLALGDEPGTQGWSQCVAVGSIDTKLT
jgi:hypothetical protein